MPVLSYVHQLFNVDQCQAYINTLRWRLLLDSRVVDLPMAYNPTFVLLSSLEALILQSP